VSPVWGDIVCFPVMPPGWHAIKPVIRVELELSILRVKSESLGARERNIFPDELPSRVASATMSRTMGFIHTPVSTNLWLRRCAPGKIA
jgi:hypothetical protein